MIGAARRFSAWKPIRAVGRVSYGIYLWHVPVFVFVQIEATCYRP